MPSKLRKAIGAVKDQTSISLAKVTNAANLEVVILKATTHDEIPIEERYVNEIVSLVSSNKVYAAACAQSLGKRIGKTRSWVVALKSLMIVLRIFQDGDPYFPREVLHAMKRGSRILNLSGFRDDSSSSPWEYTAFVRTTALYLDERLDCFLTGKLQRRITIKNHHHHHHHYHHHHHHHHHHQNPLKNHKMFNDNVGIKDMKPSMLLDKIVFWQRLLDRAMGTRPTGEARKNRLVQISLYAVVQETFDLYRDISDGLVVILDSFFKLPYKSCLSAFHACMKSCRQFDELSEFYSFCLSIRVGRSSEYPKVQKISEELMETLQEFLRDQAPDNTNINVSGNHNHHHHQHHHAHQSSSFSQYSPLSKHLLISSLRESSSRHDEGYERYGTPETYFETASEHGSSSHCTSLEDLMIATDAEISTPRFDIDFGDDCDQEDDDEKQLENNDDASSDYESCSNHSDNNDQAAATSSLDLVGVHETRNEGEKEKNGSNNNASSQDCWELVLAEVATSTTEKAPTNNNSIDSLFDQSDSVPHHQYNPFLELDDTTISPFAIATDETQTNLIDIFDGAIGFQGNQNPSELITVMAPTFTAQSSSFETDLMTSIFGELNSNTSSCAIIPSESFSLQYCQENKHGMNSSSNSIFQSQGSFMISPTTSTSGSYDSYQTSTEKMFSSLNHDSYQISKASSTFSPQGSQGYELYQASIEPNLNSQGSFKITSISSFQGHDDDAYQISTRRALNSQNSFEFGSTPTSQGHHDSCQMNTETIFSSQNSFKSGSTPTSSQCHNDSSCQIMNTEPIFISQNSFTNNDSTSNFQDHDSSSSYWTMTTTPNLNPPRQNPRHESYNNSSIITPTFYDQNSYNNNQTSLDSTFQGHSSYMMGTTPTSHSINSYQTSIEESFERHASYQQVARIEPTTFHTHDPNQMSMKPIFQANNSFQTSTTRPNFHSSSQMNIEPTFHAYNSYLTSPMPPFYRNDSCQMSKEPVFQTHNSYQTNTLPSFHNTHNTYETSTTPSPIFRVQNDNFSMVEATPTIHVARNPNVAMVQSNFWEQNFLDPMAQPTFHAKVSNEPLLGAPKEEDDPFGSWPSSLTNNEDDLSKSMQKLSLEQQKQIWLEQQKRIIEKNLN